MKAFTIDDAEIRQNGYIGPHGWYWRQISIAGIIFKAFRDVYEDDTATVYVSELFKHPAIALSAGCHDTLHSVFVKVSSGWTLPTAEQIYDAYKTTNAQFKVEAIHGGYHFYKTW